MILISELLFLKICMEIIEKLLSEIVKLSPMVYKLFLLVCSNKKQTCLYLMIDQLNWVAAESLKILKI